MTLKLGFGRGNITPRVGVELCGFGPYLCRHSTAIRDPLWARAMAVAQGDTLAVIVSCDLIGTTSAITRRIREIVAASTDISVDNVMVHSTHTHSGPNTGPYIGWGERDEPYLETLPQRIAAACIAAIENLQPATLFHAEVPCEGIGQNREYDRDALPLEEVLREDWRPLKPELTDTTCHVLRADAAGKTIGFISYFGCHPVVCCQRNSETHGDFCGVATNILERENPGAVGLFLQGAQGDVNSCVVHKPALESLFALDTIAARYANAVRRGLKTAAPIDVDAVRTVQHHVPFTRRPWGVSKLRAMLAEKEAFLHAADKSDAYGKDHEQNARLETVYAVALRTIIARAEAGESLAPPLELHGLRLGPVSLLGTPFEVFQAIKNEFKASAVSSIPLVMGFTNDSASYAPDRTVATRGGYAAEFAPLICAQLPFTDIHSELVAALTDLDAALNAPVPRPTLIREHAR